MYDYNYGTLVSLQEETNEKLDVISENVQNMNVVCCAILLFVIVGVLLSIVKG